MQAPVELGPFVVLLPILEQKSFVESFTNTAKIKPHWCYLSFDPNEGWVMKVTRILSKSESSVPHESSSELKIRRRQGVPSTLKVLAVMSKIKNGPVLCIFGLDPRGQIYAYTLNSEENIQHAWSYNCNPTVALEASLPPFHKAFGIQKADFAALNSAVKQEILSKINTKLGKWRADSTSSLDEEMYQSLSLLYSYDTSIDTRILNKYRAQFAALTESDNRRLSRIWFSGDEDFFRVITISRLNRDAVDDLLKKINENEEIRNILETTHGIGAKAQSLENLSVSRVEMVKNLLHLVQQSPIDIIYCLRQLSKTLVDVFVVEMPNEHIKLICYYSEEDQRLFDLWNVLSSVAKKNKEKIQNCLNFITNTEFIHMVQAYENYYYNRPGCRRMGYYQTPDFYLGELFKYMTESRITDLVNDTQSVGERTHSFFRKAWKITTESDSVLPEKMNIKAG